RHWNGLRSWLKPPPDRHGCSTRSAHGKCTPAASRGRGNRSRPRGGSAPGLPPPVRPRPVLIRRGTQTMRAPPTRQPPPHGEPGNIGTLLLMAEIERARGNHTAVVDRYRTVLTIDPSNMVALNNLSMELMDENLDEALAFAQRAFELAPENPAVQDTLGWIY